MDDDFLWSCAFEDASRDRLGLLPGKEDEPKVFLRSTTEKEFSRLCKRKDILWPEKPTVRVVEIRGNGVLDSIGGEVWEASILLSVYILLHAEKFCLQSVLELGSGVGLPGLLLAYLQMQVSSPYQREICLTDNDPRCVEVLSETIVVRYTEVQTSEVDENSSSSSSSSSVSSSTATSSSSVIKVSVAELDWSNYEVATSKSTLGTVSDMEEEDVGFAGGPAETANHPKELMDNNRFEVIMGSALCYSPYHCVLADTVLHFLQGACKEVVVIQIKDREGFDRFLKRLSELSIRYTVEVVSEEVYSTAQTIRAQSLGSNSNGNNSQQQDEIAPSTTSSTVAASASVDIDEESVGCVREFIFPSGLVRDAIRRAQRSADASDGVVSWPDDQEGLDDADTATVTADGPTDTDPSGRGHSRGLISTDRESFVLVRATKGS